MTPWPTDQEIRLLRRAAKDLRFLLARGYKRRHSVTFVGDHYQLDKGLRHILFRAVFPADVANKRKKKRLNARSIEGEKLLLDGYNCFITLESGLKGLPIVHCDDGFVRDISGVFRRFRPSDTTEAAWRLMAKVFKHHPPGFIQIFLDRPYSNSGKFCQRIDKWLKEEGLAGRCVLNNRSEKSLGAWKGVVATGDSVIIDECKRLFDLTGHIIRYQLRLKQIRL